MLLKGSGSLKNYAAPIRRVPTSVKVGGNPAWPLNTEQTEIFEAGIGKFDSYRGRPVKVGNCAEPTSAARSKTTFELFSNYFECAFIVDPSLHKSVQYCRGSADKSGHDNSMRSHNAASFLHSLEPVRQLRQMVKRPK
jgi:hypothetical protein